MMNMTGIEATYTVVAEVKNWGVHTKVVLAADAEEAIKVYKQDMEPKWTVLGILRAEFGGSI